MAVPMVLLGAFAKLRKATFSVVTPVRMENLGSQWTDFHEILYLSISRNTVEKIQVSLKSVTLHEDRWTFVIISLLVLLRMRNISDKSCKGNRNTHFFNNVFSKVVPFMR